MLINEEVMLLLLVDAHSSQLLGTDECVYALTLSSAFSDLIINGNIVTCLCFNYICSKFGMRIHLVSKHVWMIIKSIEFFLR